MHINKKLLESDDITRHFMTDRERKLRVALCQLLVKRRHVKYAKRFAKLDFNIVDSTRYPDFTAAISFEDATVFVSDGFLGSGEGIFRQLDVLLRHELAHNLMMHMMRLMHLFKRIHGADGDEAYEHIKYSASLHDILNCIEDFEISNKRYTAEDKRIVRAMMLNGRIIGGLVTEDHRSGWVDMSLEVMYEALSQELIQINSAIRSDPAWRPNKETDPTQVDMLKLKGAELIAAYSDAMKPSSIKAPIDVFITTNLFKKFAPVFQELLKKLYEAFKDTETDQEKQNIQQLIEAIAGTGPLEKYRITHPGTGEYICTVYTPEDKVLATDVLKNIIGNINYNPAKFHVKKKTNSQEYKDAWNAAIKALDTSKVDDATLAAVRAAIERA